MSVIKSYISYAETKAIHLNTMIMHQTQYTKSTIHLLTGISTLLKLFVKKNEKNTFNYNRCPINLFSIESNSKLSLNFPSRNKTNTKITLCEFHPRRKKHRTKILTFISKISSSSKISVERETRDVTQRRDRYDDLSNRMHSACR